MSFTLEKAEAQNAPEPFERPYCVDVDRREHDDERHICPLQLEVIRRGVELWTNPGDVVLSPFAGIGSEGFVSVQMGRKFVGVELKDSYYRQASQNLGAALRTTGELF